MVAASSVSTYPDKMGSSAPFFLKSYSFSTLTLLWSNSCSRAFFTTAGIGSLLKVNERFSPTSYLYFMAEITESPTPQAGLASWKKRIFL